MRSIRIRFKKTGDARYISHLDLTRYFSRMLRRTDIPVWYTEGYNPRVYMVFSLSLPLSVEGENEYMDLRLTDDAYTNEDVFDKMKTVSVPGIEVTGVNEPVNAIGDITYARYTASCRTKQADELQAHTEAVMSREQIPVIKVSKKGPTEIDLKEHVRDFSAKSDGFELHMSFVLPAGSVFNINPLLFIEALFKESTEDFHNVLIKREMLLLADMNEYR